MVRFIQVPMALGALAAAAGLSACAYLPLQPGASPPAIAGLAAEPAAPRQPVMADIVMRARIALPEDATIEASVSDAANGDVLEVSQLELAGRQLPVQLAMSVPLDTVEPGTPFSFEARITREGDTLYVSEPRIFEAGFGLVALGEIEVLPYEAEAAFTARGHEPGWMLRIGAETMDLLFDYGQGRLSVATPEPEAIEGGARYVAGSGLVSATVLDTLCSDAATGLPYPSTVTVSLGERSLTGCGGEPETLIAGDPWRVEAIGAAEIIADVPVTIQFDGEGQAGGRGGCNSYGAGYTISGEGIRFGPVRSTLMACSEDVMDQERALIDALEGVTEFGIDDTGALVLTGSGERITARR